MEKNKQKLLAVLDILNETDELHPITANRITERLRLMGIEAERKSVLRDIAALSEYGCDIILHPDNKLGFYIGSRTFEDWELKILMDSVQSSFSRAEIRPVASSRECCCSLRFSSSVLSESLYLRNSASSSLLG